MALHIFSSQIDTFPLVQPVKFCQGRAQGEEKGPELRQIGMHQESLSDNDVCDTAHYTGHSILFSSQ